MNHLIKRILTFLLVLGLVFTGLLASKYTLGGVSFYDIFLIFSFIFLTLLSLYHQGKFKVTKLDGLFWGLYIFTILLPTIFNFFDVYDSTGNYLAIILPVKIYLVYRIFLELEILLERSKEYDYIIKYIIYTSIVAAIIGLLRFIDFPFLSDVINSTWPIKEQQGIAVNPSEFGRLVSTMSGTNGGATFFSIVSILSFFQFLKLRDNKYLYIYVFFLVIIFLTGSLTSLFLMTFLSALLIKKYLDLRYFIMSVSGVVLILTGLIVSGQLNQLIGNIVETRIQAKLMGEGGGVPLENLVTRYNRWDDQLATGLERPFFGYASKNENNDIPDMSITHNYYVFLFIYTGILGLIAYLLFYYKILQNLYRYRHNYFIYVVMFILIAQITQLTNNYGGVSELLGILFFINRNKINE